MQTQIIPILNLKVKIECDSVSHPSYFISEGYKTEILPIGSDIQKNYRTRTVIIWQS